MMIFVLFLLLPLLLLLYGPLYDYFMFVWKFFYPHYKQLCCSISFLFKWFIYFNKIFRFTHTQKWDQRDVHHPQLNNIHHIQNFLINKFSPFLTLRRCLHSDFKTPLNLVESTIKCQTISKWHFNAFDKKKTFSHHSPGLALCMSQWNIFFMTT